MSSATLTTRSPLSQPQASQALCGRDMLCFSHDWGGDPLSKTHLMRLLARDNRVLWVNSIGYRAPRATVADFHRVFRKLKAATTPLRQVAPQLFVLSPLAIPAWGSSLIQSLNARLLRAQVRWAMRQLCFRRPINWVFNPVASVIAGTLGEAALIYYCVDEYAAFSGVPKESLARMERQLLEKADAVIVSAERLWSSRARINPNTVLVRHGVDVAHFRRALLRETAIPDEIAKLPRPVLGYFGLMSPDWVDLDLLVRVATHFHHGSLVLLGKVAMDLTPLQRLPNVHVLGRKPYEALPGYCKGFDVALIPFPVSEVTLNANPLKAREYLAAGLPVVSTAIPEVEVLGQCRIGNDAPDFISEIESALAQPGPDLQRSQSMDSESWEARLNEIRGHLLACGVVNGGTS